MFDIHHGDNLEVMQRLRAEGVRAHLIYADPPFNTGRDFIMKGVAAYTDRWKSEDEFLSALCDRTRRNEGSSDGRRLPYASR